MTDVGLVCVVEHCDLTELKEVLLLLLYYIFLLDCCGLLSQL